MKKLWAIAPIIALFGFLLPVSGFAENLEGWSSSRLSGPREYRVDLNTRQTAGVYSMGNSATRSALDFELGSAFNGTIYACDLRDADTDGNGTVDTAANCEIVAPLRADYANNCILTEKRFIVMDIDTAESTDTTPSRLTFRRGLEGVSCRGHTLLCSADASSSGVCDDAAGDIVADIRGFSNLGYFPSGSSTFDCTIKVAAEDQLGVADVDAEGFAAGGMSLTDSSGPIMFSNSAFGSTWVTCTSNAGTVTVDLQMGN